jgi:hypothetical protein
MHWGHVLHNKYIRGHVCSIPHALEATCSVLNVLVAVLSSMDKLKGNERTRFRCLSVDLSNNSTSFSCSLQLNSIMDQRTGSSLRLLHRARPSNSSNLYRTTVIGFLNTFTGYIYIYIEDNHENLCLKRNLSNNIEFSSKIEFFLLMFKQTNPWHVLITFF